MKPSFFPLVFLSLAGYGFGQSFTMTDPVVQKLHEIAIESGRAFTLTSFPVSDRELARVAESLEPEAGGADFQYLQELHDRLTARLPKPKLSFVVATNFVLNPDYLNESDAPSDEVLKDYLTSDPFAYLGISLVSPQNLFLYFDIEGRQVLDNSSTDTNLPFGSTSNDDFAWRTEYHDIRRGVIAFFFDEFDLYFGRDKVQYGPDDSSLLSDPDLPWTDAFRMETYLGPFTMSWKISTVYNGQAENDVVLQPPYSFNNNTILNNLVRFQYTGSWYRFAFSDQAYFVQAQNAFQLGDFFPVFSWHNADFLPNNNSVVLDATVVPVRGVEITGQFGLDDVNGNDFGIPDSSVPNIDAEILSLSVPKWEAFYLELGQTHYLWGNFDDATALARAIYRVQLSGQTLAVPMTSPYGPGAIWQSLRLKHVLAEGLSLGLKEELIGRKNLANLTTTSYQYSSVLETEGYNFELDLRLPVIWTLSWGTFTFTPGFRVIESVCTPLFSLEYHWDTVLFGKTPDEPLS